jgi:hypothetical protein
MPDVRVPTVAVSTLERLERLDGATVMIESTVGFESPPGDGVVGQAARWA